MSRSVLQDWVMGLSLRAQGTMLTVIRGCDESPKTPETINNVERQLVAYIRWCVLVPADPREVDAAPGCWMQSSPPQRFKPSALGHLPQHFYAHVMHALEVIGYEHPNDHVRFLANLLYRELVDNLHLEPESREAMRLRLEEDRIATGRIVS